MVILAVDYGDVRTGIAVCDKLEFMASPVTVIRERDEARLSLRIAEIAAEKRAEKIILGLPKNMNNTVGDRALTTLEFKKMLEDAFKIEVVMQDERLTTKEASSYMIKADISRKKRKKKIDSLAANIILQTYLDKERNEKSWKEKKN